MKHAALVNSVVVAIIGVAAVAVGVVKSGTSAAVKSDVVGLVSSPGASVGSVADLSASSGTTTLVLAAGDSRADNYRLERDGCCPGVP